MRLHGRAFSVTSQIERKRGLNGYETRRVTRENVNRSGHVPGVALGVVMVAVFLFANLFTDYGVVGYFNNSELTMMHGTGGAGFFGVILLVLALEFGFIAGVFVSNVRGAVKTASIVLVIMIAFGLYNVITYDSTRQDDGNFKIPIPPIVRMYGR